MSANLFENELGKDAGGATVARRDRLCRENKLDVRHEESGDA